MPEITVPEDIYARIREFKQVVETVIEEQISDSDCVKLILEQGIDSMVATLLGSKDPSILLASIQQLGGQFPTQVYGYITETLKRGAAVQEREQLKRKLGFLAPGERGSNPG